MKKIKHNSSKSPKAKKRPRIDFEKCGIPIGAKLVFKDDPKVIAYVESNRKVSYNGEITSLSTISSKIKGCTTSGPANFTYNGKLVCDIAEETQWKDL